VRVYFALGRSPDEANSVVTVHVSILKREQARRKWKSEL